MYTSLRATSKTLKSYLEQRLIADPALATSFDSSKGGTMQVSLATPEEMTKNDIEGLSVWLYNAVRDAELVNMPPRRLGPNQLEPAPLPLLLHYLVTPIVRADKDPGAETRQAILGKTLQAFYTRPRLRGTDLQDDLSGTTTELTVRLEQLPLDSIARIWEALESPYELSVSYEVSMVSVTAEVEPEDATPVAVALPEFDLIIASGAP
jgi:hypothetical protein